MTYLVLSIVALFVGVVLHPLLKERGWLLAGVDGFVLASVGGLACLHLIPHSLAAGGFAALGAIALGMLGPTWLERRSDGAHEHGSGTALVALVVTGLGIHAALDGSALALPGGASDAAPGDRLALAVLFPRLPIGFVIAWLAPSNWSHRRLLGLAAVVAAMTVLGYAVGQEAFQALEGTPLGRTRDR